MESGITELRAEVRRLQRQVQAMRWVCLGGIACALALQGLRPGAAGNAVGSRRDDDSRLEQTLARAGKKPKETRVRAPLVVIDAAGREVVRLGAGSVTGAGFVETFNTQHDVQTFSGNADTGNGLVEADQADSNAGAALSIDGDQGVVETFDANGDRTFRAPAP
jgi:hypothetical protein